MTSERTSNFGLPLYTANDITSWLVDFNGAMNEIDTAMQGVKTIADQAGTDATGAAGSVAEINQTLVNIQNSIANINNSITSIWKSGELTGGNSIEGLSYALRYREASKMATITFTFTARSTITYNTVLISGLPNAIFSTHNGFMTANSTSEITLISINFNGSNVLSNTAIPSGYKVYFDGVITLN